MGPGDRRLSEPSGHSHSEDTVAADVEALREAAMAAAERAARAEAEAATSNAALDTLRQQMEELRIWGETEARVESSRRLEAVVSACVRDRTEGGVAVPGLIWGLYGVYTSPTSSTGVAEILARPVPRSSFIPAGTMFLPLPEH